MACSVFGPWAVRSAGRCTSSPGGRGPAVRRALASTSQPPPPRPAAPAGPPRPPPRVADVEAVTPGKALGEDHGTGIEQQLQERSRPGGDVPAGQRVLPERRLPRGG